MPMWSMVGCIVISELFLIIGFFQAEYLKQTNYSFDALYLMFIRLVQIDL
jgi:hypothetical protein